MWLVAQAPAVAVTPVVGSEPSSHANSQVCESAVPASVNCTLMFADIPSRTGAGGPVMLVISGAALFTVTEAVYSVNPASLSLILPLTVRVPLSVVGQVAVLVLVKAP